MDAVRRPGGRPIPLAGGEAGGEGGAAQPSQADLMEYLADMILELREIADKAGAEPLARILTVAHAEARFEHQQAASSGRGG